MRSAQTARPERLAVSDDGHGSCASPCELRGAAQVCAPDAVGAHALHITCARVQLRRGAGRSERRGSSVWRFSQIERDQYVRTEPSNAAAHRLVGEQHPIDLRALCSPAHKCRRALVRRLVRGLQRLRALRARTGCTRLSWRARPRIHDVQNELRLLAIAPLHM